MPSPRSSKPSSPKGRRAQAISAVQARRLALAAQGFAGAAPRTIRAVFDRVGVVQIDSVNVLVRSHYLPLFSRLGSYDMALLEKMAYGGKKRVIFEYWAHEASLVPVDLQPLLRWRMAQAERLEAGWTHVIEIARTRRPFVNAVLKEIEERGALSAGELGGGSKGTGSWWGWSDAKRALEWLFWAGKITTAYRRGFERVYDLPERVLPAAVLAVHTPQREDAQRELLRIAARAYGVATERDLRDYFRLSVADAKARITELVDAGELAPAGVEGWAQAAYLWRDAKIPRTVEACALLSPFDSLIWERSRTERLFDFSYRLALYTPAHKRTHGYYVLPFLYGDRLVARVDLRSSRADRTLDALAIHYEPGMKQRDVTVALREELARMATWLGHERVRYGAK